MSSRCCALCVSLSHSLSSLSPLSLLSLSLSRTYSPLSFSSFTCTHTFTSLSLSSTHSLSLTLAHSLTHALSPLSLSPTLLSPSGVLRRGGACGLVGVGSLSLSLSLSLAHTHTHTNSLSHAQEFCGLGGVGGAVMYVSVRDALQHQCDMPASESWVTVQSPGGQRKLEVSDSVRE